MPSFQNHDECLVHVRAGTSMLPGLSYSRSGGVAEAAQSQEGGSPSVSPECSFRVRIWTDTAPRTPFYRLPHEHRRRRHHLSSKIRVSGPSSGGAQKLLCPREFLFEHVSHLFPLSFLWRVSAESHSMSVFHAFLFQARTQQSLGRDRRQERVNHGCPPRLGVVQAPQAALLPSHPPGRQMATPPCHGDGGFLVRGRRVDLVDGSVA